MKLIRYEIVENSTYVGKKYGKLTIIEERKNNQKSKHNLFLCICDCGKRHQVDKYSLINGDTKSCGCFRVECGIKSRKEDKRKNTRLYNIWQGMKARCYNPNNHDYSLYGAKGITICEEWLKDFNSFKSWSLNNGYNKKLSIDRINSNKNYSPDNCRWVTIEEQSKNRTNNTYFSYNNKIYNTADLSKVLKVNYNTLKSYYNRHGNLNKYNCINSSYEEYINK